MGKLTISMAIFTSYVYVRLPEGSDKAWWLDPLAVIDMRQPEGPRLDSQVVLIDTEVIQTFCDPQTWWLGQSTRHRNSNYSSWLHLCIFIYTCMYVYIYIYIYLYTDTYTMSHSKYFQVPLHIVIGKINHCSNIFPWESRTFSPWLFEEFHHALWVQQLPQRLRVQGPRNERSRQLGTATFHGHGRPRGSVVVHPWCHKHTLQTIYNVIIIYAIIYIYIAIQNPSNWS